MKDNKSFVIISNELAKFVRIFDFRCIDIDIDILLSRSLYYSLFNKKHYIVRVIKFHDIMLWANLYISRVSTALEASDIC